MNIYKITLFRTSDRATANLSVRLMAHMNRFSYITDDITVSTNLELKMWMKPGGIFNGCPPIHEKGCHDSTPGEDVQVVKEELGWQTK